MKRILTIGLMGLCFLTSKSQNASVEKSVFGIQAGYRGLWVNNETRLTNQIALRSEIGIDYRVYGLKNPIYFLKPMITAEPRWYYNLNKRESKSKRIDGNSGNFVSLKNTYYNSLFGMANFPYHRRTFRIISIIPT
jgi:hypothetical protein